MYAFDVSCLVMILTRNPLLIPLFILTSGIRTGFVEILAGMVCGFMGSRNRIKSNYSYVLYIVIQMLVLRYRMFYIVTQTLFDYFLVDRNVFIVRAIIRVALFIVNTVIWIFPQ